MFKFCTGTYRIICAAGLILLVLIAGSAAGTQSTPTVSPISTSDVDIGLTEEEEAWLAERREIVLGATTEYPPLLFRRADGMYDGVLANLYDQLNRRLGNKLRLHIEDPWSEVQKKAKARELDGLALAGETKDREAIFNQTDKLFHTYFSVFARSQNEFRISRFEDLDGLRIGYKRGAGATRALLEKLPSVIHIPYDSHESITQALLSKEIDVIVAWLSYDFWIKERLQGTIDKILLIDEYPLDVVAHIRDDWPPLIPIFNKAIASLQRNELPLIINKWFGQSISRPSTSQLTLTAEERAWVDQEHTVRVRVGDHPPWHINTPEPGGMVVDYLNFIAEKTGINFKFIPDERPWIEGFEDVAEAHRRFDLIPTAKRTPEPLEKFAMSDSYLSSPWVIFTRHETSEILGVEDLRGKKVAVVRGDMVDKKLSKLKSEIFIITVDDTESAAKAVSSGTADAHVGNLLTTTHLMQRAGIDNVKVAGPTPFEDHEHAMATRKEWAPLISIINKALASISEEEKSAIRNKYISIKYDQGLDKGRVLKWFLNIAWVTLLLVVVFGFWNRRLAAEKNKRKDAEEKLLTTFDRMPIAACLVDKDGNMYFHNNRFIDLFGYAAEEIPTLDDWWPKAYPDKRYRDWVIETWGGCVRRSEETGSDIEAKEYRVTCKGGHTRDMEISGISLGERYLATLIDNTERNRTQEELEKAKEAAEAASRAKSQFLANVSHELRTPLNAILGFSSLLRRDLAVSSAQKEKLDIVGRSGEHLLSMINDILDLSKIEAGRLDLRESTFDVKALFTEISAMFNTQAEEKGLSFTLQSEEVGSAYLSADVGKVRQILINLLSNAIKATREGGITLRYGTEPIQAEPNRCCVSVEVADTGPGISSRLQERIFEPFVQGVGVSTSQGTGLGLAISKKLSDLLGGTLELETEAGAGTSLRLRFPAAMIAPGEVAPAGDRPRVTGLAPGQETKRILVVDDDTENRLMLRTLLEQTGLRVCEATNGVEAQKAFEQESPDFIWMDMRMPVMDGYEAVRQIRRHPSGGAVPIVALTANALREQRSQILAVGCDDLVVKPYREQEVFDIMAQFLNLEYVYEGRGDAAPSPEREDRLTAAMLAKVPTDLLRELDETTLALDMKATLEVIQRIEGKSGETARHLRTLVQEFQIDQIRNLLQEVQDKRFDVEA